MKRKPRVIRVRGVLVCLVFAVVVAVGSVPLLAWRAQVVTSRHHIRGLTLIEVRQDQTRPLYLGQTRLFGFHTWNATTMQPTSPSLPQLEIVESDPRPSWALPPDGSSPMAFGAISVGWPFRSARAWQFTQVTFDPIFGPLWLARPPSSMLSLHMRTTNLDIPIVPFWPGLIANTLIFFAIPFVPWTILRRRRLRRIERLGLCYTCRYEFPREIEICPECGTTRPPN